MTGPRHSSLASGASTNLLSKGDGIQKKHEIHLKEIETIALQIETILLRIETIVLQLLSGPSHPGALSNPTTITITVKMFQQNEQVSQELSRVHQDNHKQYESLSSISQ